LFFFVGASHAVNEGIECYKIKIILLTHLYSSNLS
jgi:hypothetical protein